MNVSILTQGACSRFLLMHPPTDQLTLQGLPDLRRLSEEMKQLTTSTSALLTYYLTLRDAHKADAETYNAMIRDLVAGATSKFAGGANKGGRRSPAPNGPGSLRKSASVRSSSNTFQAPGVRGGSGAATPQRSASPAVGTNLTR